MKLHNSEVEKKMVRRKAINCGLATKQDPLFGIDHSNIAARLTIDNFKEKAVVRIYQEGWLYLWISEGTTSDESGQTVTRYLVQVHTDRNNRKLQEYGQTFPNIEDALAYANGENEGKLAVETRLAEPAEYPDSYGAPILIGPILNLESLRRKKAEIE